MSGPAAPAGARGSALLPLIGALLVLAGLLLAGLAWARQGRLVLLGEAAEGEVVGFGTPASSRSAPPPVVRFRAAGGREVRFEAFPVRGYEVGDRVAVRYLAGDPRRAEIDRFRTLHLGLALGTLVGLGAVAGGVAILRRQLRARSRR